MYLTALTNGKFFMILVFVAYLFTELFSYTVMLILFSELETRFCRTRKARYQPSHPNSLSCGTRLQYCPAIKMKFFTNHDASEISQNQGTIRLFKSSIQEKASCPALIYT
jgi:hypothetical protein